MGYDLNTDLEPETPAEWKEHTCNISWELWPPAALPGALPMMETFPLPRQSLVSSLYPTCSPWVMGKVKVPGGGLRMKPPPDQDQPALLDGGP